MLRKNAPEEAKQDSNFFRRRVCYTELTDGMLRRHRTSLHSLFTVYSAANRNVQDDLQSEAMMSIGEWVNMCEHLGLFATGQLSLFGAKIIFMWSRIRSARDYEAESEARLRNLFFEDFLEALVRVACVIALPTDSELAESGAANTGQIMTALRSNESAMEDFVRRYKTGWQHEPRQSAPRCVAHLISMIVETVEGSLTHMRVAGIRSDSMLSTTEVSSFELLRRRGNTLHQMRSAGTLFQIIIRVCQRDSRHF